MDKELRALNKLIKNCHLVQRDGECNGCINKNLCTNILGELSPLAILQKLEKLKKNYSRIK